MSWGSVPDGVSGSNGYFTTSFFQQGELEYRGQVSFTGHQVPRGGFCPSGYEVLAKTNNIQSLRFHLYIYTHTHIQGYS